MGTLLRFVEVIVALDILSVAFALAIGVVLAPIIILRALQVRARKALD
jgi:hypothetical protein